MNGFQLRSEDPDREDNTAANNLRAFCSASESYVEGDGLTFGNWTQAQHCDAKQAICGIQTQVEQWQGCKFNQVEVICIEI